MQNDLYTYKEQSNIMSLTQLAISFLFFMYVVIEIISSSSFPTFIGVLGQHSTVTALLVFIISLTLIFTLRTPKQFIILVILFPLLFFSYKFRPNPVSGIDFVYQCIVIFSVSAAQINIYKLIKIHLSATIMATLLVISLSLIDILPKSGQVSSVLFSGYENTVYAYGFNHPNFLGSILSTIGIELIFLFWDKLNYKVILANVVLITLTFLLGANTAAVGGTLFLIISVINWTHTLKHIDMWIFGSIIWSFFLSCFALYLARLPYTNLWNTVNRIVTSRPALWSYYFAQFRPKFIGSNVIINTSSVNTTFGNGILDGSYIYQLFYNGYFGLFILLVTFCMIAYASKITKNTSFVWVIFVLAIMAFPENEMSVFYTNIFLVILGYCQFSHKQISKLLSLD